MKPALHLLSPESRQDLGCAITAPHPGRGRLHLADLDNLHGSGNPGIRTIDRVRTNYDLVGIGDCDLFYAACNHDPNPRNREQQQRTFHICSCWPNGTVKPVHGKDAADLALVARANELLDRGNVAQRFDDVVIASGDHLFALVARRFRRAGLTVHLVISREQALSRDLARAADGCIWHLNEQRCLRHGGPRARYALAA